MEGSFQRGQKVTNAISGIDILPKRAVANSPSIRREAVQYEATQATTTLHETARPAGAACPVSARWKNQVDQRPLALGPKLAALDLDTWSLVSVSDYSIHHGPSRPLGFQGRFFRFPCPSSLSGSSYL